MKRLLFIFLLIQVCKAQVVVPFVLSSASGAPALNYIVNGDTLEGNFEYWDGTNVLRDWVQGQSGSSTTTDNTTQKYDGSHSVKFTVDGSTSSVYILIVSSGITGKTVHWSFRGYAASSVVARVSSDDNTGQTDEVTINGTTWTLYTGSFVANDDYFEISRGGGSANKTFSIDCLKVWITP